MSWSPADISNAVFSSASLGTRSYDKDEVDAFVEEAQREIIRMRAENRQLREELRGGPTKRELAAELERLEDELVRAEQRARDVQVELERCWTVARGEPQPSPGGLSEFIDIAQRFADQHVQHAERDAEALLNAARTKADKMLTEAQLSASTIDSDARARHGEAINRLFGDRAAALEEIDRLKGQLDHLHESLRDRMTQEVPKLLPPAQLQTPLSYL
ncbi:DivIVA domain-containing protein [Actinoplanes sp. NEAU-A12]|uniref:Cell wall synthesis protein Wag31 n=1 Tax=Actinoplanes sandaracinus TaxID=3045177 RepID=A0ABT6WQQ3_9ACTN|nr:DivIVA domain-containing protein [Actinoplanes sandaracinus]MDI6102067.1 DivIVA domain-containing protein [Actinoplanes sandaracinus]